MSGKMACNSFKTRRAVILLSVILVFNILFLVTLVPRPHDIPHGHVAQRDTDLLTSFDAETSRNQTLLSRGNSKDDQWIEPMYLLVPEEKINALPDYDEEDPNKKRKILAARKGFRLLCNMRSPAETIPTDTSFKPREGKSAKDIRVDYGWSNRLGKPGFSDSAIVVKLGKALSDLKLSKDPADWIVSGMDHKATSKGPDGQGSYPVTKGSYENLFDLANGGLIAAYNYSPEEMASKLGLQVPASRLVPFRKWSDVVWVGREEASAKYKEDNAGDGNAVKNLEHVFQYNIVTESTEDILRMVTGQRDPKAVGVWPGVSYPIEEPQGLAVLGTVHGAGVAWMLSQHKEAMGVRAIDRINVFNCDPGAPCWCIYLHISDVATAS
ncbi:uncharacterized protein MYCFIDRAFT_77170 [Pseudocercospora fijiensis CIRAD86]|uniref:Uncharacterized protein n=1 Tax=Pseudocercospora fijiensis (strain CIRAD86) TaxID=383855 RepID=M2ZB25_PSEFD|nr:uncharacterized protein MYCFIDRAFT_77170 [Pseudocercospora fijiensis CIRAD86]EME87055.1 hypothetical protein MYCFIDRAFT_77170 [Pseudocercospora fijiensis CIRAD86]